MSNSFELITTSPLHLPFKVHWARSLEILKIQFVSFDFLFVFSATKINQYCLYKRYFNADLKISLYIWVLMKMIPRKFRILNPKNFSVVSVSSLKNISYICGGYISGSKRCCEIFGRIFLCEDEYITRF